MKEEITKKVCGNELFRYCTYSALQFRGKLRLELNHGTFTVVTLYKNFLTIRRRPPTCLPPAS